MINNIEHLEFESKYRVEDYLLIEFKKLMNSIQEEKKFIYVEGPDTYYTHPNLDNGFGRYRKPSYGLDNGRSEFTVKVKPSGAKNNILREEVNWRVDGTSEESIDRLVSILGFKFNFSIYKSCQIFKFEDATLVFYTVYDTTDGQPSKADSFLEIEVCEEKIKTLTEKEAYSIIAKWEAVLAPLGIKANNRLKKSLYEIYKR